MQDSLETQLSANPEGDLVGDAPKKWKPTDGSQLTVDFPGDSKPTPDYVQLTPDTTETNLAEVKFTVKIKKDEKSPFEPLTPAAGTPTVSSIPLIKNYHSSLLF